MEGKDSKSCCPPGASCEVPANSKAYCKCGPEWTCVIEKVDDPKADTKPFYNCDQDSGCVCDTDEKVKGEGSGSGSVSGEKQVVETEGAYCVCGKGYKCTITKTKGPDAGKVFVECGNGCKCVVPAGCDGVAVLKDQV